MGALDPAPAGRLGTSSSLGPPQGVHLGEVREKARHGTNTGKSAGTSWGGQAAAGGHGPPARRSLLGAGSAGAARKWQWRQEAAKRIPSLPAPFPRKRNQLSWRESCRQIDERGDTACLVTTASLLLALGAGLNKVSRRDRWFWVDQN